MKGHPASPPGWRTVRLDAIARPIRNTVAPDQLRDEQVLHISIPSFDASGGGYIEAPSTIGSAKSELHGGEVLVSKLNPRKARVLVAPESSLRVLASGEFIVLKVHGCRADYLAWLLTSDTVRQKLDAQVRSVTRSHERIDPQALTKMWLRIPPEAEQQRIADFLAAETARVAEMKQTRKRLIELARERMSALVFHSMQAVDAEPVKLARFAGVIGGAGFPHEFQGRETGDLPFVKASDLQRPGQEVEVREAANWVTYEQARALNARVVPPGAVIFPKVGAAMLKNPRRIAALPCCIDNNLMAVVPRSGSPRFLRYRLMLEDFGQIANPGPVPSLNEQQVKSLRIPWPSEAVQNAVSDELDVRLDSLESLVRTVNRSLAMLDERRTALIDAATNGTHQPLAAVQSPEAA